MNTFKPRTARKNFNERGSAILIVVLTCSLVLILLGVYLSSLSTQSKLHYRAALQNESRNAAEGMAEYALAELNRRAESTPSFGIGANPDPLSGYTFPAADRAFIAPGTGYNHIIASSVDFKNSPLSNAPTGPMLIDPADPINFLDPARNSNLSVRSLNVFAKASVLNPATNLPITTYVAENIQIREQAWFNYAVFYNMDIEFHAGPNFTVLGPVHTNADAYLTEGSGNELDFFASLTTVGKIYRYDKYDPSSTSHPGTVKCIKAAGMLASNLVTMPTTQDSRNASFQTIAASNWKSFVQDCTFFVKKFSPQDLPGYTPENFSTGAVELRNNAYLMIEPQLSKLATDLEYVGSTVTDYGQKTSVTSPLGAENLKFSALSSFVIQVFRPTAIGLQPKWKLLVYKPTDPTYRLSSANHPERDPVTGKPIILQNSPDVTCTIDPFNDKDDQDYPLATTPGGPAVITKALKSALLDAIVSVPYRDTATTGVSWGDGRSDITQYNQIVLGVDGNNRATFATNHYPLYDRREGYIYPGSPTSTTNGLKGAMHVLKLDLAKLNTLLNDTTGMWKKPYGSTAYVYNPSTQYTGVIYVQLPLAPIDTTRFPAPLGSTPNGDQIRMAQAPTVTTPGFGVVVANAGTLPQLAGGSPDGFTIATNGPLYVWGNFNADGLSGTGSSTTPDTAAEVPALIAADSVTILSSNPSFNWTKMSQNKASASSFTEVSAAVVAGLVPTQPGTNDIWSGGVHNLVRFLENWSGSTYRYRGSIAVLYESEVAKHPWHESYFDYWYNPPTRDIGYHQYLSQGRFPPATPIIRTVRRMSLVDLVNDSVQGSPAAQYAAGPGTPLPSN